MNLREAVARRIFRFRRAHALRSGYDVADWTWEEQEALTLKDYYDLADAVLDELGIVGTATAAARVEDAS